MKNYILFKIGLILLVGLLIAPAYFAQTPSYTCTLANDVQTADSVYEFDIYLLRTGTTSFELAQIQFGFLYNDAIKNGGTLTASYVSGSVDSIIIASGQENISFNTATDGCIKIASKLPAKGAGFGAIISNVPPGTRIGRLKLTNTFPFAGAITNVTWNFNTSPYPSKVFAYVGGINTDITVAGNHINSLNNFPLPIVLQSFTTIADERNITLRWETKLELNAQKFEVERQVANVNQQMAAKEWQNVGEIKAVGNSNLPQKYSFIDKSLNSGKYSYKLKLVNNDGTFKYSDPVEGIITGPKEFGISQNYPNPFNPSTKIKYSVPFESNVRISVYNAIGETIKDIVMQVQKPGYYEANFVASGLASGIYFYSIKAASMDGKNNYYAVKKMILLK